MIVVTGAAGFIGSCLLKELSNRGYAELVAVDDFSVSAKRRNWEEIPLLAQVDRAQFDAWLEENGESVQFIFHIGARTNTAEFDIALLDALNLDYSKMVWQKCVKYSIPLVYASSAATYGLGEKGFSDTVHPQELSPLNPYGVSKNEFDKWVLEGTTFPPFWAGFKFFNVYGPNEYHKDRMASVVWHAFNQIHEKGYVNLFKSHKEGVADGEQRRDFIYVKDVLKVLLFFMEHRKHAGIYNLGSGAAGSFLELSQAVYEALGKNPDIRFIPTPEDIREKYQYYTCADLEKLRKAGYEAPFYSLREGVVEYTSHYLTTRKSFDSL
jgi:ADP-L-glycero-D-manno-heptose 6-epimerase